MQNDVIGQIKDKLQHDLEQCTKDKKELKAQGLFSQSDVILGRETEIKELQEYIKELEEPTTTEKHGEDIKDNIKIEKVKQYWYLVQPIIPPLHVGWEIYPISYQEMNYVIKFKLDLFSAYIDRPEYIVTIYEYRKKRGFFTKNKGKIVFEKPISILSIGDKGLLLPNTSDEDFVKYLPQITKAIFELWETEQDFSNHKSLECDWDGVVEDNMSRNLDRVETGYDCGRDYVKQTGKCPMCIDCPHNCPLDKIEPNPEEIITLIKFLNKYSKSARYSDVMKSEEDISLKQLLHIYKTSFLEDLLKEEISEYEKMFKTVDISVENPYVGDLTMMLGRLY